MKKQHYLLIPIVLFVYMIALIIGESYDNYKEKVKLGELSKGIQNKREHNNQDKEMLDYYVTESYKVKMAKESKKMKFPEEETIHITENDKIFAYKQNRIGELPEKKYSKTDAMSNPEKWIYLIQKK